MLIKIVSLSSKNGGEEIEVGFEIISDDEMNVNKEKFIISAKQYLTLGLCKGVCDTQIYDTVCELSEIWSAVKKGTSLLNYSSCSGKALERKLISKGFDRTVAEQAVANISSLGLLNGEKDAKIAAQKLADKLWGRARIGAALYEKGFAKEDIQSALDFLEDGEIDYIENCRRLFEKKYGELPREPKERRSLVTALIRYGYTTDQIRKAINLK